MSATPAAHHRTRLDRCPGVLRPWPADDGLLVRLRLIGGRLRSSALARLLDFSAEFADGRIHLTKGPTCRSAGWPDGAGV